ncbi:hypothetical protein TNCV_1934521 [Trichonephila clavipes]|nr:hypothetical protein TNCV_1934521 [Trichonephila clavipes]
MDEVPLSFDVPPTRTVDVQGARSIPINTTGNERTSFTVVLCCAANVRSISWDAQLAVPNDTGYARLDENQEIRQAKEGY